ncbi:motile sperm domain-containing protein 2 [Panicum miliaceum]|uniref:Motile sperm domain-containing protein 2 n=2 Tax=Panicum sect. Panicum TaxID=2100772 RepID=A0A3L6QL90_PANMI|nr:motile sperm domain-containing protein 2 [Panicum miliaceum]
MAASCSFRSVVRAPPLSRSLGRSAVRCRSAATPGAGGAASNSKLVLEVKERLEREHPGLPTGRNGRDDDDMILWFLKDRKFSVDEAVSKLTKAIKWRQDFGVSELSEESVKGLYQTGKAYVHDSLDIYGRPVLVVVAAKHFPSTQDPVENEKLCAYLVEKAINRLPSGAENILGIFDLRGFRVENGDLQFLKFLIDVFYYYYPKRLGQVLFVDAPFVFQPMWQVVKPLLKSYASLVRFCDSETVRKEYFTEETVPPDFRC